MSVFEEFSEPKPFREAVAQVEDSVTEWFSGSRSKAVNINQFAFPVYLKNRERVLSHVNSAYQIFFANEELPTGKHSDSILTESVAKVSAQTDAMMRDGYSRIELEHAGVGPGDIRYLMRTHKIDLSSHRYEPYAILGVSIPTRMLGDSGEQHSKVEDLFLIYESFDQDDKQICSMYALGESTRSIAERIGRSAKTIENHRHRILDRLGLAKPVQIIRLLVRFEERGLISDFTRSDP